MKDKDLERLIKSIEDNIEVPSGLKKDILEKILFKTNVNDSPVLTRLEKFIFEKPLRAACMISPMISGVLWIALGNGYTGMLQNIFLVR